MLGEICPELSRILFWSLVRVPIGSPLASTTSLFFRGLVLGEVVDRRQVLGDSRHHPEDHRGQGEDAEPEQDEENAQLLQPRLGGLGRGSRGGRRVFTAAPPALYS